MKYVYMRRHMALELDGQQNVARYYDPDIARFISQDPLGLGAGLNPYAYAGNDPVNVTDPSGLDCYLYSFGSMLQLAWVCDPVSGIEASVEGGGGGGGGGGGTNAVFGPRGPVRGPATQGVVGNYVEAGVVGSPGTSGISMPQADTVETDSSRGADFDACSASNLGQEIGHHATVGPFGAVSGATVGVYAGFVVGASGGGTAGAIAGAVAAPFAGPVGPAVMGSGIVTGGLGGGVAGAAIGGEVGGVTGLIVGSFAGATKAGAECMLETLRF